MKDSDFSLSSLLCQENEAFFNAQQHEEDANPGFGFDENDEEEYVQALVEREKHMCFVGSKSCDFVTLKDGWLKVARLDAIRWIFRTRSVFGFHFHTLYLSVVFFDRFLSKRSLCEGKLWAIRLLAVACLSIAAKMEECKVPPLSEFNVQEYEFENIVIQRMELLVLSTLEWKMALITPVTYMPYLVKKLCGESRLQEMVSRAFELVELVMKEVNLADYGPSIMAAAAVLAASDSQLARETIELKMSAVSSLRLPDNEHIFSLYNLMLALEMPVVKTPTNSATFSDTSSIQLRPKHSSSAAGAKRRLAYNDSDKEYPDKKILRP